jgi:carbamoyl-phosphate synthase large subunit
MKPTVRILLTGAGSPAAPGVIRSLRLSGEYEFHIVGLDCNRDAAAFYMADRHYIGPRATDDSFSTEIQKLCRQAKIDIMFSLVTGELIKLSEMKDELLRNGTRIPISSVAALSAAIHKGTLYETLRQQGIAVPDFVVVDSPEKLKEAIHLLGYPNTAVCFKPTVSDGSRGFHILDAAMDLGRLMFREKPNTAYVSETDLFQVIEGRTDLPELIVMEYLPFEEYSVDLLANEGQAVIAVPRLRESIAGGVTTKSVIRMERDIIDYAVKVVEHLKLNGNIGIQIRRDKHGKPKIVEINPRIQGTIVHCTAAGINMPVLAVKQVLGHPIAEEELTVKWGTRMLRYWEEVFYDDHGSAYAL